MRRDSPPPREVLPRTLTHRSVQKSMTAVREAFRQQRLAHRERLLYGFYIEHNLLDEAQASRATTLGLLRDACQNWRTALGLDL